MRRAWTLVAAACLSFVGAAAFLGTAPLVLSPLVLVVLLGYSHAKRFTWASHLWLGVALALAPGGAWIAAGARPDLGVVALMLAVACWVCGFDILYSLQDERFDRSEGLRSIPARFGARRSLVLSRAFHVACVVALALAGKLLGGRAAYFAGVVIVAALLVYEQSLLRPFADRDEVRLDRLDKAFFDVNGWVSLGFLALVAVDVSFLS